MKENNDERIVSADSIDRENLMSAVASRRVVYLGSYKSDVRPNVQHKQGGQNPKPLFHRSASHRIIADRQPIPKQIPPPSGISYNSDMASEQKRTDKVLLAVTALYCVSEIIGVMSAAKGAFGQSSLFVAQVLVCGGLAVWIGVLSVAVDMKCFGWAALFAVSIAILCTTLWTSYVVYEGMRNI